MDQQQAARRVIETITAMAADGKPLMTRVLPEDDVHFWAHYPDQDARDAACKARWYYHVHEPGERDPDEHGHFHLFLHRTQIDPDATPVAIPAAGEAAKAHVTHIAGLSIDQQGIPLSWFVTNRWVTNEFMYPADVMIAHLDCYDVDHTQEDGLVNRFLTGMVALYRDELGALLVQRDDRLAALAASSGHDLYEKGNAVLASLPIDLDAKMEGLGLA